MIADPSGGPMVGENDQRKLGVRIPMDIKLTIVGTVEPTRNGKYQGMPRYVGGTQKTEQSLLPLPAEEFDGRHPEAS